MLTIFEHLRKPFAVLVLCFMVTLGMSQSIVVSAVADSYLPASTGSMTSALGLMYQWHTFYGIPDANSEFRSIAVDTTGSVYVAGYAHKAWGSPLHAYSGDDDIVIVKFNSQGAYQWHTFYGASPTQSEDGDDDAAGITVDGAGNVYVTGYSDRTWNGPGNIQPLHPHGADSEYMFVLKLNTNGAYQWHTFYQPGRAKAIAIADVNAVYVTGYSNVEWGAPLHSTADQGHIVVLKLNTNGAYQWHTYYGAGVGAGDEAGYGIAADATHVYVTGAVTYSWLGNGFTAPLHAFSGDEGAYTDIVVLKLSNAGSYVWHTFYGAGDNIDDVGKGIALGPNSVTIAGQSSNTWGAPLHAYTGGRDIAVLKLNSAGQLQWHTFYGSSGDDDATGITVNAAGTAYVAGWSTGSWTGSGIGNPSHPYSGNGDADIVVFKLNSSGGYERHTFQGAVDAHEYGVSVAMDSQYGVYTTGISQSTWQGNGGINPIHPHSGNLTGGDGFVLKLSDRIYSHYLPMVVCQ